MKTQLLKEAKKRASEIAEKTTNCPEGYYTAIYEGENTGIVVSYIQKGFDTRPASIGFGSVPLSEKQVLNEIELHQLYELQF